MARDPYQELGVSRTASADEIRKAFRKLAKQHHPDANPGDKKAEEKFKQVSAAFDIVGDAEKRKKFDLGQIDADGRETMRGFGGQPGNGPFNAGGFGRGGFRTEEGPEIDLSDLFGGMFGGGRGPFGGGGGQSGGFAPRGADVKARLEIDLEEAIKGGKKRVAFTDGRTIDVTIPAGAQEGQTLRLKGRGFADAKGKRGDLLARLVVTLPETIDQDLEKFAQAWREQKPYTPKRK